MNGAPVGDEIPVMAFAFWPAPQVRVTEEGIIRDFYALAEALQFEMGKAGGLSQGAMKNRYTQNLARKGQTLVEYALIVAFVSVVGVAVMGSIARSTKNAVVTTENQLNTAQQGGVATASGR